MPSNPTEADVRELLIKLQDYQRRDEALHAFEMPEYIAIAEAYLRLREAVRLYHGGRLGTKTLADLSLAKCMLEDVAYEMNDMEPPNERKDSPCT